MSLKETQNLRIQLNKLNIKLKNLYVNFPHHKNSEDIEFQFCKVLNFITKELNWIDDRLTEKILYAEKKDRK